MQIHTVNPASGERLEDYPYMGQAEVRELLERSDAAWQGWRETTFAVRAEAFRRLAANLHAGAEAYAELMAREMGKPLPQARAEIEKCSLVCEFYAENAERFLQSEEVATEAARSYVAYRPLGVVLAIMPWNFPYWQVFRFAAPALMAGNVALLKHAPNVTGCALAIENLFRDAGFPEDVFRTLLIQHEQCARVIEDPAVRAVTLTGSVSAGRAVASLAGASIKKTVLELGGSDPYIILEDADLGSLVPLCVRARMNNSGQTCIAAKRFLVVEPLAHRFTEMLVEGMRAQKMGDPFEEGVDLGPQARRDLRDHLHSQVLRSIAAGADLLLGGQSPRTKGFWYPPTVLSRAMPGMPAFDEEIFGPVAAITTVRDEDEAVRLANQTEFGLGAAVFTADTERGRRIAEERLEAGACFVNDYVRSDPRLPFGGIRNSGYGRELGRKGILEFVNTKTVYVR